MDYIEKYLNLGWKLINLSGKIPINKDWQNQNVFNINHQGNTGIQTGKISGIVVLDLDVEDESIKQYLPYTPMVKTGKGEHYYFKYQGGIRNSVGKIAEGVDVRSDNGYVVAPPSIHPDTKTEYKWIVTPWECELAEFPKELIEKLNEQRLPVGFIEFTTPIIQGGRNNYLTSLAGSMRRKGFDSPAIFAALNEENKIKCKPPLPENEVKTIAESVSRYKPEAPIINETTTLTIEQATKIREGQVNADPELKATNIQNPSPILYSWSELKKKEFEPVELIQTGVPFIDNYFAGGLGLTEISLIIARQETGKTTLGCQIGSNAVKQGFNVLQVVYEDAIRNTKNRYAGHLGNYDGLTEAYFIDASISPVKVPQIEKYMDETTPGLVIIDYFARVPSIRGMNETRFEIRDTLMRFANLARTYNCHVLVFDHVVINADDYMKKEPDCYWTNETELSEAKMYKLMICDLIMGMKKDRHDKKKVWFTGMKNKRAERNRWLQDLTVNWERGIFNG